MVTYSLLVVLMYKNLGNDERVKKRNKNKSVNIMVDGFEYYCIQKSGKTVM